MTSVLAALLAAALPVSAVSVPAHEDPGAVFARSRKDPGRLYALILSATWCTACKSLHASLEAYSPSTGPVAAASWALAETDLLPEGRMKELLPEQNGETGGYLPVVLAVRDGRPLGYSTRGADLGSVETFLGDALAAPARAESPRPRLSCAGAPDWASFTLGVSGLGGAKSGTDWFGREVLLAFRGQAGGAPARLLAPPRASSATLVAAPSGGGVFFAPDPTIAFEPLFGPVGESTRAVQALASAPGGRVRVILTGHGGPAGIEVGKKADSAFGMEWAPPLLLEESSFSRDVEAARRAGKEVHGLVTACFGGQFAPAFLPLPGAAPACAAFATVPDKAAEGCYADSSAQREDYASSLARALSCPAAAGRSRERHYLAVQRSKGRDVPMLSSEYFLMYGAAAQYLGRESRLPPPPGGVLLKRFPGGLEVLLDAVGGTALSARVQGHPVPGPRVSVLDCREDAVMYGSRANYFALRHRGTGPAATKSGSCTPELALDWDEDDGLRLPPRVVLLGPEIGGDETLVYDPGSSYDWERERSAAVEKAAAGRLTVDGRNLRPEARALLGVVLPRFGGFLHGDLLMARVSELADELMPDDAELAKALVAVALRARDEARARREKSLSARPASAAAPALTGLAGPESPRHEPPYDYYTDPDGDFSSGKLTAAMLDNLTSKDLEEDAVSMARLAHLVSAASLEVELRRQARDSAKARALASQLASLQLCERGVLD
jgi:hypothetical protein